MVAADAEVALADISRIFPSAAEGAKRMRILIAGAAVLVAASCATSPNQNIPFVEALGAPAGSANLYIYRKHAPPYLYKTEIYIDGDLVGKIPEGGYSAYPVPIGDRTILVKSFDWPDVSFELPVKDSSDLFIKFTGDAWASAGGGYGALVTIHSNAAVYLVERSVAVDEITGCCRFVQAKEP